MGKSRSDEDLRHLTHMLLEAPDTASGIALACLRDNRGMSRDEDTVTGAPAGAGTMRDDGSEPNHKVQLKPIEREVVAWVAAGKSYADIATILELPYSTVRYHLGQARRRNGFHTVTQLVVRAAYDFDMCPLKP